MNTLPTRLLIAVLCIVAATGSAGAFDPAGIDILRLRLGMSEADVVEVLAAQGNVGPGFQRGLRACSEEPAASCLASIAARTKDGMLTIRFSEASDTGQPLVMSIEYRLDGKGQNEPGMIRAAVLERFGQPSSMQPLAWCQRPGPAGLCLPEQARLTFDPLPNGASILLLSAGMPPRRPPH